MSASAASVATLAPDEIPDEVLPATRRRPGMWLIFAVGWLAGITLLTFLAPLIPTIREPDAKVRVAGQVQSAYRLGPGNTAWWGTDSLGFDVFARCIAYAKNSLLMGFASTAIGLFVGGTLGILAGYFRGWVDRVISIIIDCLLAVPALILALMLIQRLDDLKREWSFLEPLTRKWQIILTLSLLAVAPLARIVRAQTLALGDREFVLAARSIGTPHRRIIRRELLPNLIPTMVTVAFTGLGILVAAEAALAFLQLGIRESWGYMIEANRKRIDKGWWATVFPSLMLFLTVMSANLVGDRLARRYDIRESSV